jgi:hypothetical protein
MEFLIDTALLLNVVIPMLTRTLHAGFVRPTSEPAYSTTPSHDHRVISSCRVIPEAKNQLFLGQHDRQTQVQPEIEFLENFIHRIWSSEKSVQSYAADVLDRNSTNWKDQCTGEAIPKLNSLSIRRLSSRLRAFAAFY